MADTNTKWNGSGPITGHDATISAGGSGDTDIDLETDGWDVVVGDISVTLSDASGITVELYRSIDGGTSFADARPLAGGFSIDSDGQYALPTIMGEPYVRVRVINDDGSNDTGTITVRYKQREWTTS